MRSIISLLALVALLAAVPAHADEVQVIQLKHRTAEQLIPTLRPLMEPGSALTGTQSSLIIRASAQNIAQIREVLASLDTVPRRLMIYVRQNNSALYGRNSASVSGRIGTDDANVNINNPSGRDGVRARILDSRSASDEAFDSQVQAVEGNPAYIAVGQSVPVPYTSVTRSLDGTISRDTTTEYRDITSGVYVVPYLSGERVTLEISPQRDTPGNYGRGSANIQHLSTTAYGRLGEWIELGGVAQSSSAQGSGILSSRSVGERGTRSVWVKVEEIR